MGGWTVGVVSWLPGHVFRPQTALCCISNVLVLIFVVVVCVSPYLVNIAWLHLSPPSQTLQRDREMDFIRIQLNASMKRERGAAGRTRWIFKVLLSKSTHPLGLY